MAKSNIKNIFKYENRETGQLSYFGKNGEEYFRRSKNYKKFKFLGMISLEEKEQEEIEALELAEKNNTEAPEVDLSMDDKKTKANTKQLSAEEIEKLTKGKKTKVKKTDEDEDDENLDPTKGLE